LSFAFPVLSDIYAGKTAEPIGHLARGSGRWLSCDLFSAKLAHLC